jgi:peroxiredoxin
LVELQVNLKRIEAAGITLVAISYDPVDALKEFAGRSKIAYPLLSDVGSKTIDAYGIRDPDGDGIPLPGTYLIDREGIVRARLFQSGYTTRHTIDELIEASGKLK